MKTATITKGTGYYLTDQYPIGGCFRRAVEDMTVEVERTFDYFHGTNAEGKTSDGKRVAFDSRLATECK